MAKSTPVRHSPNDLAVWRTALPSVQHAFLPASSDRSNPKLQDGVLFGSIFAPGSIFALDASDGKLHWRRELAYFGASVLPVGEVLLAGNGQALHALDTSSGSVRWEFCPYGPSGETVYSNPVVDGHRLFLGDRRGWFHCLDLRTGETIWEQKLCTCSVNATAMVAGGLVITATNDSFAVALSIEDGAQIWKTELDGPCAQHLTQVGKHVIVSAQSLYFLEPTSGELQGRLQWPGRGVSFAAVAASQVALFTRSLPVGRETAKPVERKRETLFLFEGTRLVHKIPCSGYTAAVRYSDATGLLYAAGLLRIDILNGANGEWLDVIDEVDPLINDYTNGYALPEVANDKIYAMNGKGVVYALRHPKRSAAFTAPLS